MKFCIDWFIGYCLKNDIISEHQTPWLQYGMEKRLSTIIGFIPFSPLAALLSDWGSAFWFIGGFCTLRNWINGYHAKTQWGCILASLGTELLFLVGLYPILTPLYAIILGLVCIVILLLAPPYNHPNIHLSHDEINVLKVCNRHRVILMSGILTISCIAQLDSIVKGLTTGIAMATYMLCCTLR